MACAACAASAAWRTPAGTVNAAVPGGRPVCGATGSVKLGALTSRGVAEIAVDKIFDEFSLDLDSPVVKSTQNKKPAGLVRAGMVNLP